MDSTSSALPKPALLMRRMGTGSPAESVTLSREASAPMLRLTVEAVRGRLVVQLAPAEGDEPAIQWTQNGVPIAGQTGPALYLAGLTAEDGDVYFAQLGAATGEVRSQAVLVVVVPGNPLLNVSARGRVSPEHPLIVGFVVGRVAGPVKAKRYLLRVLGESLRRFGVVETLTAPRATLHRGKTRFRELVRGVEQDAVAREWGPRVGAFALEAAAAELVAVVELPAGAYSLFVTGDDGEVGEVLAEVYEIPE